MPHKSAKQFSSTGTGIPSMSGCTSSLKNGAWTMVFAVDPSGYGSVWGVRVFISPQDYPINIAPGLFCVDDTNVRDVSGLGWAWSPLYNRNLPAGWSRTADGYIQAAPIDSAPVTGGATITQDPSGLVVTFPASAIDGLGGFDFTGWAFGPDQVMHEIAAFFAPYN